ncbi:MAG TPA: AMP-binding protein, partial [Conexibacter sp.]|nr:AMP-binding protein [Conexibacter sp.]
MNTVASPLRRACQVAPDATAIVCGERTFTYAQTAARCRRLVGALHGLGLGRGDRVAVVGPNDHRYLELYLAIPAAGMVLVPLNARHTDAELRYALEDSGTRVVFAARPAAGLASAVERVVAWEEGYDALLAAAPEGEFDPEVTEETLAGLFYTGGTTGAAKGVMLTHRNLVANAWHFLARWPFDEQTRWLVAAPLFHAAGTIAVLATVWGAGRQVMLPAFDADAALDLIAAERVTHTLMVPTMLAALTEAQRARPRDVSSLRWISHGGSPIARETVRRAAETFPDAELLHIYGATETAPIATLLSHEQRLVGSPVGGSCGQPAIGVDVRVVEPASGRALAPGEVGEVLVRGANVMRGYWNKPAETAEALSGGWYRSGDLGYLDEHAHLHLVDRAKDMIVTGGENVYCSEVEDALFAHPAVLEATVFGVPDARWGEAVHAVVVPRAEVEPAALIEHCRARIAAYKLPKRI